MAKETSHDYRDLFRLIAKNVEDFAIFATDLEGRAVSWNPGVGVLLGFAEGEWVGRDASVIFTPEDRAEGIPLWEMETALREGRAEDQRWHLRKDGSRFWADGLLMLLRDEGGHARGFAKIMRDATAHRLTEERLREQLGLTETITGTLLEGIHVLDLEGRITFANSAALEMLGYGADELIGRHQHETVHYRREDGTPHRVEDCPIIEVLRTGVPLRDHETVYTRRDGSQFPVLCTSAPILDHGRITGTVMTFHDISERRRAEAKLLESEERFRALAETAADVIVTIDAESQMLFINPAAEKVFGYRPEELVGQPLSVLMPEHLRRPHRTGLARYVETGRRHVNWGGVELPGLHRDGREIPLDISFGEFRQGSRRVFTGIIRDITERKRAEEERERLLREAQEANRLKDEFLATVSHELRTPLTAILGWAHLLRGGGVQGDSAARALETIERNARSQSQLIDDLLDVSRIVTGQLRLDVVPVSPHTFIDEAVESVRPAAEAKGVRLQKLIDTGAETVMGDPARLQQVVWNLLANAIKFTPRGGRVQVRLERVNSHVEIAVADTGAGIDPDFLPHVFDRFRQADQRTTRQHGGLGLGLAIVRHLVELHGGTVRADSAGDGTGSTFTVSLPVAPVHRKEGAEERVHPAARNTLPSHDCPERLDGLRLLVVDDEADARELLAAGLGQCGAQVTTASSAPEALEALAGGNFAVLVSDIGMPGEDGYELIRKVRALPADSGGRTPAVAVTAYARTEDRLRAMRAGFEMHVSKPVELTELIVVIANLARRGGPS
jgi:PAS domain S-box-containing protein